MRPRPGDAVRIAVPIAARIRGWLSGHPVPPSRGIVKSEIDSLDAEGYIVTTKKGAFIVAPRMVTPDPRARKKVL